MDHTQKAKDRAEREVADIKTFTRYHDDVNATLVGVGRLDYASLMVAGRGPHEAVAT